MRLKETVSKLFREQLRMQKRPNLPMSDEVRLSVETHNGRTVPILEELS